jgi:hypothetical protein
MRAYDNRDVLPTLKDPLNWLGAGPSAADTLMQALDQHPLILQHCICTDLGPDWCVLFGSECLGSVPAS